MTFDDYQELAMRTAKDHGGFRENISYAGFAISGEAGEAVDLIKKGIYHGHGVDYEKLALELGDVLWGLAYAADVLGLDLDDIASRNIAKLKKRYPNGYSDAASRARVDQ